MPLVCPRLRHHVNDRAARTTEFGREAVLIDLKFLYRFLRKLIRRSGAGAAERLAKERVVIIRAIHLQTVESSLLPSHCKVAGPRWFSDDPRSKRRKVQEVAAIHRQILNGSFIDSRSDRRARRLDDLTLGRDIDHRGGPANL